MNFRVRQSWPPAPPSALSGSGSSDDSKPTRVTPSMSSRAETKPATASCPGAQPLIFKAGPGTEARRSAPPPVPAPPVMLTSGEAVAVRSTNQTSSGRSRESSRTTRSQSKRLSARLLTVSSRCSCKARNCVYAARRPARISATESSRSSFATSALLSATLLSVSTRAVTPMRSRSNAAARRYGRGPVRIGPCSSRRSSTGIRLTGRMGSVLQRKSEGKGQACRCLLAVSGERRGTGDDDREAQTLFHPRSQPLNGAAGSTQNNFADRESALLRCVIVERKAELVDEGGDPLLEDTPNPSDYLRIPLDLVERAVETDVRKPLSRVVRRKPELHTQILCNAFQPLVGHAGKEASAPAGHGQVHNIADVAEKNRLSRLDRRLNSSLAAIGHWAGFDAREGPNHPKRGKVDSDGLEPGTLDRPEERINHFPSGGNDDDVDHRRSVLLARGTPHDLVLEDRLVERHRDLLLRLEADRGVELLRVVDRWQAKGADDDPLVADPETDPLGELVVGKERLQRAGDSIRLGDLSLVKRARRQRGDRGAGHLDRAVPADLSRGDAAGLDVESDQIAVDLLLAGQLQHACSSIGRKPENLCPASTHLWGNVERLRKTWPDTSRPTGLRRANPPRRLGQETARRGSPASVRRRRGERS